MTHALAAAAIRRHLWQPEPPGPLGGRPWTMARELQVFDRLIAHGWDRDELLGAIEHVRAIANTKGPARMTWLVHPQRGRALLSRAVAEYHRSLPPLPRLLADIRRDIYDGLKDRDE